MMVKNFWPWKPTQCLSALRVTTFLFRIKGQILCSVWFLFSTFPPHDLSVLVFLPYRNYGSVSQGGEGVDQICKEVTRFCFSLVIRSVRGHVHVYQLPSFVCLESSPDVRGLISPVTWFPLFLWPCLLSSQWRDFWKDSPKGSGISRVSIGMRVNHLCHLMSTQLIMG